MANDLGIKIFEGKTSLINLTINGQAMEVPALVQPGQANGTIGLALGYGRKMAGKVANGVGFDVYPFLTQLNGTKSYVLTSGVS